MFSTFKNVGHTVVQFNSTYYSSVVVSSLVEIPSNYLIQLTPVCLMVRIMKLLAHQKYFNYILMLCRFLIKVVMRISKFCYHSIYYFLLIFLFYFSASPPYLHMPTQPGVFGVPCKSGTLLLLFRTFQHFMTPFETQGTSYRNFEEKTIQKKNCLAQTTNVVSRKIFCSLALCYLLVDFSPKKNKFKNMDKIFFKFFVTFRTKVPVKVKPENHIVSL